MRLVPIGLYVLACAFSYALVEAKIKEEKIFKKKLDDHQTLTSGYAYHHLSTSVLPRGFEANKVHHDVDGLAGSASQGDHSVIHETAGGLGASGGDHGGDAGHSVAAVYKFSVVHGTGGDRGGEHGSADYNSDNGVVNADGAHHGEHDDIAAMIGRYSMDLDSNVVHGVGDNVKLGKVDGTKGKADGGGDEIASALSGSYTTELTNFDLGKSGSLKSNDVEGQSATTGDGVSNYVSAPHHAASDGHDEEHDHEESDEQDDDYGGYGDFDGHYWDFGGTDDPYGDHDDHGYFDFYGDFGFYDHYGDHSVGGNYGGGEGHTGHAGGGGHGGQEGGGGHGGYGDHGGHRGGGGGGHGGHGGGGGGIGGHYSDVGNAYHASNYFDHVFEDDEGRKGHRLFDDGLHDHYDKEGYKNFHVEDGGSEKDHHDEDEVHGDHHEFEKGSKDGHFGEKKGHDKGTKTKGYHNVLHKDEYTKEHTFYDNAHRGGHFVKDGDFDTHFHVAAGDHKKGEHYDSAYDFDHSGKKDYKDKGHLLSDHIGHDNKEGFDSHHHFETDFGHKGAGRHGKDYGFWNHHGDEHKSDHGGS